MIHSYGRGGAGNMADNSKSPQLTPQDLATPTLKNSVFTTGRGGSGNMAHSHSAAESRKLQDVEAVERRPSHGAVHSGRGGAGNVFNEDADKTRRGSDSAFEDEKPRRSIELLEKGKNFLHIGHKKH